VNPSYQSIQVPTSDLLNPTDKAGREAEFEVRWGMTDDVGPNRFPVEEGGGEYSVIKISRTRWFTSTISTFQLQICNCYSRICYDSLLYY
jgi:hypothetical protein